MTGTLTETSGTLYDAKAYSASTGPDTACMDAYARVLGQKALNTSTLGEQVFTKVRFVFTDEGAAAKWWPVLLPALLRRVEFYVGTNDVTPSEDKQSPTAP